MEKVMKPYQAIVIADKDGKFLRMTKNNKNLIGKGFANQGYYVIQLLIDETRDEKGRRKLGQQGKPKSCNIFESQRPIEFTVIGEELAAGNVKQFGNDMILTDAVVTCAIITCVVDEHYLERKDKNGNLTISTRTEKIRQSDGTFKYIEKPATSKSITIVVFEDEDETIVLERESRHLNYVKSDSTPSNLELEEVEDAEEIEDAK